MGNDILLVQREGDIATVILNRPEKLNALSRALWQAVGEAMRTLSADEELRCIVLRGAEDKAFSPGADISEFETERSNLEQARSYGRLMHEAMAAIRECQHPTIALIKGVCVGGGLELASMCDLRICGQSSRFGVPINRIGVIMAYPEIAALIDLVGRSTALEILLEGRVFDAQEAREKGLVTRVVADDQVEAETYATARRIADGAPISNRLHKKFARRLLDPRPLTPEEFDEGFANAATEDYQEGYRAFVEKRKPQFRGK
jgi:enoyl-CoA hydratase